MKSLSKNLTPVLILGAIALAACSSTTISPRVSDVAINYPKFNRITAKPVRVNPELAMLCVGISKAQVEEARKQSGPHANTTIVIYMNDQAANAFRTNSATYPVGAIIVKQKMIFGYTDTTGQSVHGGTTGVGGMIKRPAGYDPQHGDWEYFYFEDVAKIESGRIASCVQCHESAKSKDYVFGSWNQTDH